MRSYLKISPIYLFVFFAAIFFISCSEDTVEVEKATAATATTPPVTPAYEVENFIYRGMSDVYLYKNDVAVLKENYFASQAEKNNYFSTISSPEALFKKFMSSQDRFSYLIENYKEMDKMYSGTTSTTGMEFGLVNYCNGCSEVLGYVRNVLPGSNADENGVKRGMIFNRISGQQLTTSNYSSLLAGTTYTIGLAKIEDNNVSNLPQEITLSKKSHSSNPVVISKTLDIDGTKVGYLYYNSFDAEFDEELNTAFGDFKGNGITDLVLDLRYNGGGSVRTATDLAAMITGQFPGKVFMKEKWNEKYQAYYEQQDPQSLLNNFNKSLRTGTAINSLNLSRVFVLTTKASASASELIINGLDPYINVIHIGDVTTGKFQASVTLYDSPNFSEESAALKTSHTYAMQPLVLKSLNANNVSDYSNGLNPDLLQREDITNLGTLGDVNEPLLKTTIDYIKGNRVSIKDVKTYTPVGDNAMFEPNYQAMYLDDLSLPVIEE